MNCPAGTPPSFDTPKLHNRQQVNPSSTHLRQGGLAEIVEVKIR
jgi:hypothetical protein